MKKIININFHSRVIPIEETAYEILQQYIDSLRRYFAHEEGRDEIISDIENRFSELFADKLKKGAPCITDEDVNAIIASMGRPEEFEGEEAGTTTGTTTGAGTSAGSGPAPGNAAGGPQQGYGPYTTEEPRRLYRAANDKVLGGVCAGLANYLRLDPAVVRILFVLISFGWGFGFLLYIILWIVLPTRALVANARKRLYRNPDDRVIAGVASGLAAYFHIDVWIPRLIFALPMILGIFTSIFQNVFFHMFHWGGHIFFDGFGGSLFIVYIVLWIVLPEAITASEKLEMRGEKVDLESIKNTVKSDLETFKGRAKEMGAEMGERMQQMGQQMGQQIRQSAQSFGAEAGAAVRKSNNGIGHTIGVLFKAFFLLIAGLIAFSLIIALTAVAFSTDGLLDLKNYILDGFWQNFLAWSSFFLFLVLPVVALLTWLIRRITGMRSRRHYLGYIFATLWVIGLLSFIVLAGMVMNNFRARQHSEEEIALSQPSHGSMVIRAQQPTGRIYDNDWWFENDWRHHGPFYNIGDDSILLTTVQIKLLKSDDSSYHVRLLRISRGKSSGAAMDRARQIVFPVSQSDSILLLSGGFPVSKDQKFRNQQVIVAVYIPLGKKIMVDRSVNRYDWFNISPDNQHFRWDNWDSRWSEDNNWDENLNLDNSYYWNSNVQYVMTPDGLSKTSRMDRDEDRPEKAERPEKKERSEKKERDETPEKNQPDNNGYRYKGPEKPARKSNADSPAAKSTTMLMVPRSSQFLLLSTLCNTL
jgi:phage shock protein PspC (stress-responsive transcriptional regulator)